jgi:hypothetical protein
MNSLNLNYWYTTDGVMKYGVMTAMAIRMTSMAPGRKADNRSLMAHTGTYLSSMTIYMAIPWAM